jgi:hypothetical protein
MMKVLVSDRLGHAIRNILLILAWLIGHNERLLLFMKVTVTTVAFIIQCNLVSDHIGVIAVGRPPRTNTRVLLIGIDEVSVVQVHVWLERMLNSKC